MPEDIILKAAQNSEINWNQIWHFKAENIFTWCESGVECWQSYKLCFVLASVSSEESRGALFIFKTVSRFQFYPAPTAERTHLLRKPPDREGRFGNKGKHLDQEKQQKTARGKTRRRDIFPYFRYSTPTDSLNCPEENPKRIFLKEIGCLVVKLVVLLLNWLYLKNPNDGKNTPKRYGIELSSDKSSLG